ncbi:structural protein [Synechococcus phage S-8S29]|nr:structural protein [Synechococcus phage S-8S29]
MFVLAPAIKPAALFTGSCSGHGVGVGLASAAAGATPEKKKGVSHHPGLGGGMVPVCPHISLDPRIVPKSVPEVSAVGVWPPTPQLPLYAASWATTARVFINKLVPICDGDMLTPHPTPSVFTTSSVGYKCKVTLPTPAWWCTIGVAAGRELPIGHARKCVATTTSVFIQKKRIGRFADPLGDGTPAFPCLSLIAGSSINVFVGS